MLAGAHEFWIDSDNWQVPPGAPLIASLRNGEEFKGVELAYIPRRTTRFEVVQSGTATPLSPRMGDRPAVNTPAAPGLAVIVHETTPSTLTYKDWDKWLRFTAHKDFPNPAAAHDARGLPRTGFTERYTRHAKALMAVGDGAGADAATGMETEFIALTNPYTGADRIEVQLLYQGTPRPDAQVEVFARAPDGTVTVTTDTRTDAAGRAVIAVTPGFDYLLDAVVFRPGAEGAAWRTLWAALSFHVPAR